MSAAVPPPNPPPGNGVQKTSETSAPKPKSTWAQKGAGFWAKVKSAKIVADAGEAINKAKAGKKFEVPVKVDVDFIKPAQKAATDACEQAWASVPPDMKPHVKPAATFFLGLFLASWWQGRKITEQRIRLADYELTTKTLRKERDEIVAASGVDVATYARIVAELTASSARAAQTAIQASQACYLGQMHDRSLPPMYDVPPAGRKGRTGNIATREN
ncbi:unnamed protein product [Pedinophyceae sp. YPF-701]|nr:unnamed protein product [Pedinophyceae sp. YPF-701]